MLFIDVLGGCNNSLDVITNYHVVSWMIRSSRAYLFHRSVVWKDNGFQCATEERNYPYLPQESQSIAVIMDIRVSHI